MYHCHQIRVQSKLNGSWGMLSTCSPDFFDHPCHSDKTKHYLTRHEVPLCLLLIKHLHPESVSSHIKTISLWVWPDSFFKYWCLVFLCIFAIYFILLIQISGLGCPNNLLLCTAVQVESTWTFPDPGPQPLFPGRRRRPCRHQDFHSQGPKRSQQTLALVK